MGSCFWPRTDGIGSSGYGVYGPSRIMCICSCVSLFHKTVPKKCYYVLKLNTID